MKSILSTRSIPVILVIVALIAGTGLLAGYVNKPSETAVAAGCEGCPGQNGPACCKATGACADPETCAASCAGAAASPAACPMACPAGDTAGAPGCATPCEAKPCGNPTPGCTGCGAQAAPRRTSGCYGSGACAR